jgi:hypothetical protein
MTDETTVEEQPKKPNFAELLGKIYAMDNELIEYDPLEHKDLYEHIKTKVDDITFIKDTIESRIEYHKSVADEHKKTAASLEKSLDRLRNWCVYALQSVGSEREKGNKTMISICRHTSIVPMIPEHAIDSALFAKYPEAIQRKFSWDKRVIKTNYEVYKDIAKIEEKPYVKFGINRGVK